MNCPFEIKEFDSIDSVKDWMISNQLGKRNLTKELKSYLRGVQYEMEKKAATGRSDRTFGSATVAPLNTAEKLADQYKVAERTIHNDAKYAKSIDKIADVVGQGIKHKSGIYGTLKKGS